MKVTKKTSPKPVTNQPWQVVATTANVLAALKALDEAVEHARYVAASGPCPTCDGCGDVEAGAGVTFKNLDRNTCPVCNGVGSLDAGEGRRI